jgi:EAL and modified HD-GYP domain-containing signal transduction protein
MATTFLLYGATGYVGEAMARACVQRGMAPILAGRNAAALAELELPQQVADGLLNRTGDFAPYLKLAEAVEDPSLAGVAQLCKELEISPKALNLAQMQATDWVNQLGI